MMTDPAELVYSIFSVAVMGVVLILVYGSFQGWNIGAIAEFVSSLAVPFTVGLIIMFFVLSIYQEL